MTRKFYSVAVSCAFAMAFGLSGCSDNSSSGTDTNIDTGDEISIELPTGNSSEGSEKSSSSASKDKSSSSEAVKDESSSSVTANSSASSSASENVFFNEGWREDCLAKINEYRATENLKPLALASEEKQACADKQSADDLASNVAHGHFGDCGEFAQNSGPNFSGSWQKNASAVAEYYLKMMWEDEKALVTSGKRDPDKKEDYPYIGHYLNMKNTSYTKVACGISLSADGKTGWFNVDFF